MKEKTLVIIIKQKKSADGGISTTTEQIGDKELVKTLENLILRDLISRNS